ncbi:hypothetical protein B0H34DRAFT_737007 [Crassisporium funariophilum]|nr:hypothetical protein B0H34DRAFT_737007 [Crassisporium funariophilum]
MTLRNVQCFLVCATLISAALGAINPVYIIRNAEAQMGTPVLSGIGASRASECIPQVFGSSSAYDIGLIMACQPGNNSAACQSALQTAEPLAKSLGLIVDTTCAITKATRSENCVMEAISRFSSSSGKGVLLVWDQQYLDNLLDEFGLRNFPKNDPDAIFNLRNNIFLSQSSQNCPGIDTQVPLSNPNSHDTQVTPAIITSPTTTDLAPPPRSTRSLNLYYTTTFAVPDPNPTDAVILLTVSKKRRSHAKRSALSYNDL